MHYHRPGLVVVAARPWPPIWTANTTDDSNAAVCLLFHRVALGGDLQNIVVTTARW
jgi:hypothetical protein